MSRPRLLVAVTATGTEIGKTWVGARLAEALRASGRTVAARKPAQSFEPGSGPTDAEVLAAATADRPDVVCPPHRSYPVALAPFMAADVLGREPFTLEDLVDELRWPDPPVDVGILEGAGGVASPLTTDGADTADLVRRVAPDLVVLVADAGLGTLHDVRLATAALATRPVVVHLNRFEPDVELHRRNASWLRGRGADVVTAVDELAERVRAAAAGERRPRPAPAADRGTGDGQLVGIRVLDLSVWRPGPYATQLLADLGADVLKVEPPGGDPMRSYPEIFASLSANKRSVVLDLKTDEGRARALELAARADVVVEGFRPGVAARLGVGVDDVRAVNPTVVYCSVSGFGQDGPLAPVPGHDLNYLAWAGALSPDGRPPVEPAVPVADLSAGLAAAFAICAALVRRAGTGDGERIDVALTDVVATWTGAAAPRAEGTSVGDDVRVPGYGTFRTRDGGWVALGVINEPHFWRPLCEVLGLDDDASLGFAERMAQHARLRVALDAAIAAWDRDELVAALLAVDVPVAPVLDRAGMVDLPHLRARGAVTDDPWLSPNTGHPVRFARRPAHRRSPPPAPDEHRGADFG